jgi:murein DD-endopeptidase MepM/ murein hydrolase activator NlpD
VRRRSRPGAFAAAGLTAVAAASLAAPDYTSHSDFAQAAQPPQTLAPLAPPSVVGEGLVRRGPVPHVRGRLARRVERLAARAVRERAALPTFPVVGAFNWGQEGAAYGAARSGRAHEGQDLLAVAGTPLVAAGEGVVLETGDDGGRGNYVAIFEPRAKRTYVYLHMQSPSPVSAGERVDSGQRVGEVGCTGSCFGDHLHFEVRRGRAVDGPSRDPRPLLERWTRSSEARATLPPGAH